MKTLFNTIFISAEEFRQQEKSPFFAGFLCLIAGIVGYHRFYMKHDLRFILILLITGVMGYIGFTQSWYYLIGWALWFVFQALIYFVMGMMGVHRRPRLETAQEVELVSTTRPLEEVGEDLPPLRRAGRQAKAEVERELTPASAASFPRLEKDSPTKIKTADQWTTLEDRADFQKITSDENRIHFKKKGKASSSVVIHDEKASTSNRVASSQPQNKVSPRVEAFEERIEEKIEKENHHLGNEPSQSLKIDEAVIQELDLYPTHLAALNAVKVPEGELWNQPATKKELLKHFKNFINKVGEGLAADHQLLADPDYAYLVAFFQHNKVNPPMKLVLQSLVNLSENILFNQFVDKSHLNADFDLQMLASLLPEEILQKITEYYDQHS